MSNTKETRSPWYVTTAIPYVNAKPHIGFALEIVLTDALARWQRFRGYDVRFLTGTDDNSLKNVQAARELGCPVEELVERNSKAFKALREPLNLSFDDFIRTSTDPRHAAGVHKLWHACEANGDIYKKPYAALYCVGCEQFYREEELDAGLCPEHGTRPEWVEEINYFFRLTKYQRALEDLIDSEQLQILPETRRNEIRSFISSGLEDFSISRSRDRSGGWGIPVPGDPEQVVYVWFDALTNYITALDYASTGSLYERFWLHNPNRLHVIGKGITRFHGVYWPAMLLSAGVRPPSRIFVHGYLTSEGRKISKSLGEAIDPVQWARRFGTDAVRYYLLRHVRATEDADVSLRHFVQAYNADLAGQLGNLVNRVAGMLAKYREGKVPAPSGPDHEGARLRSIAAALPRELDNAISRYSTWDALGALWELIGEANRYVVQVKPWDLAAVEQTDPGAAARLDTALYNLACTPHVVAHLLTPFLPETAAAIARQLETGKGLEAKRTWGSLVPGTRFNPGPQLFPKIQLDSPGNGDVPSSERLDSHAESAS